MGMYVHKLLVCRPLASVVILVLIIEAIKLCNYVYCTLRGQIERTRCTLVKSGKVLYGKLSTVKM